jgi:glyoxylase-like metal-dependent hydrolase (beta-lactamase superfamily II)
MDGRSAAAIRGRLACHCMLVETRAGLVLIDTGFGLRDVAQPRSRLSPFFLALTSPDLREEMTAIRQLVAMGFDPRDVRHIVLTHLDFDHAGGLDDFPWASVHMLTRERDAAQARPTALDKARYRPQQWSGNARWLTYEPGAGDTWQGFDCVRQLDGLPPEILLVPLIGHTLGHAGVAVSTPEGWLLAAGDAYFDHRELDLEHPQCTPGLRLYQTMMEKNRTERLRNQQRLRDLKRDHLATGDLVIVSGHDPVEFERLAGRPLDVPARLEAPSGSRPGPRPSERRPHGP